MFKCTECDTTFEIKPDYCDCGNDCFVEIKDGKEEIQQEKVVFERPVYNENKYQNDEEFINKPRHDRKKDLPSIVFFIVCLILSILSIAFIGNGEVKEIAEHNTSLTSNENSNIKSIDEIWKQRERKETPIEKKEIIEDVKNNVVQEAIPQNNVNTAPKQTTKPVLIKQTTKPSVKPNATQSKNTIQNKTSNPSKTSSDKNQTSQNNKTQNKTVNTTPKTNAVVNTVKTNTTPIFNGNSNSSDNKKTIKPLITTNSNNTTQKKQMNAQEFNSYRISLRNKIVSNIDFKLIIGDGSCSIRFKVDNNGKLINRSFLAQSQNSSLNDEIYNAVMKTPYFNPPPIGYNGEFMTLYVKINGGNFEISLK